jgi:hypothetical protein
MLFGYPVELVVTAAIAVTAVGLVVGALVWRYQAQESDEEETVPELVEGAGEIHRGEDGEDDVVELERPDVSSSPLGVLATVRWLRKQRKMARKGYVKWYVVDGAFPTARFVKPTGEGGGIPQVSHDGDKYLFPKDAMVPDATAGTWVCMHKKGQADPINVRYPDEYAISADELDEYLQQMVTSSPPGLFDKFNLSAQDALLYAMAGVIVFAVLQGGVL